MDTSWLICAMLLVVIIVTIVLLYRQKEENFEHVGMAADLEDGVYLVTSANDNRVLASNIVDTVQCKDFMLGQAKPSADNAWMIQKVAQGVYIMYKPGKKECLYTSPAKELRSYFFPSCDSQNLCGLSTPDWKGELDGDSLRTYFMILQHPSGKYYIKSMLNNGYITMSKSRLQLLDEPATDSLFNFIKM